jgi:hypothetical protein
MPHVNISAVWLVASPAKSQFDYITTAGQHMSVDSVGTPSLNRALVGKCEFGSSRDTSRGYHPPG